MHYVYILKSLRTGGFYIGQTSDLRQRLNSHNANRNIATKFAAPWTVVYYEAYPTKSDAIRREKALKYHGKGLSEIKKETNLGRESKGADLICYRGDNPTVEPFYALAIC